MSLVSDLKTLYHLTLSPVRGNTHAERMQGFYQGQADGYDDFRKRLLQGREEMVQRLPAASGGVWVDIGGGTGSNLEYKKETIGQFSKVYVVDLATSLLEQVRKRSEANGWTNVEAVEADAVTFVPPEGYADVVSFSYSLTMIPDWFAALAQARKILKPGGTVGVVDFYVSRKHPSEGRTRHSWATRTFWPTWFGFDNVFPCADHLPYLTNGFETEYCDERRAKIPYLPLVRAPYYLFLGKKPETA